MNGTAERLRERVELYEPVTETVQALDDDGKPTGKTFEVMVLRATVELDGMHYLQTLEMGPEASPLFIERAQRMLVDALVERVLSEGQP